MNRAVRVGLAIAVVGGVAAWWYYNKTPRVNDEMARDEQVAESSRSRSSRNRLNVNAIVLKPTRMVDRFSTTGLLLPDETVDLTFESAGKVTEINFEEGSWVKKGDLLARTNDADLRAQRVRLTTQLKLATDRVYRQAKLLESEAVSKEALEQVETDLAMLQADIDIIDAKIALKEIRAPFDGMIGLRQVSVGDYAYLSTVVATLTKNAPLKVEFAIPERYATHIGKGTNLTFTVDGELESFKAKVYAAESSIDASLHQYTLRAIYPNTDGRLMAGRFALVQLNKEEVNDAIAIPSHAIVPEMGRDKVFLYRSGRAEPVEILAGMRTESQVQVLRGLQMGDTLIVSGTLQLRTGLEVELDNLE
ncbi:MAG: efflux RND transporter periplasmic adaptor subunit [Rikenellaceae bacterium]